MRRSSIDKVKHMFDQPKPASDEVLYGTSDPLHHPAPPGEPQLHTTEKGEHEHSLLRQILNPGNAKYDETRFTSTSTTEEPHHTTADGEEALVSGKQAKKDTGLMRQILNPHGDKYDSTRFGTTGETDSAEHERRESVIAAEEARRVSAQEGGATAPSSTVP